MSPLHDRIDTALARALSAQRLAGSPPHLASAVRHAVFPGGGRVRPLLTLSAARACGDDAPGLSDAAAAAVELIHCASLVHDDLPIFDDADQRRGRPTVHALFGSQVALLAGDALIVHAFDFVAESAGAHCDRAVGMTRALAAGVGMPSGIIGGQAWECEPRVDRAAYHRAKTGALFRASLEMGAIAAGHSPIPWRTLGDHIGAAYQLADDLQDVLGQGAEAGKPVGQDLRLGRPNAVVEMGVDGAIAALARTVRDAEDAVPACVGRDGFVRLVRAIAARLVPAQALPAAPAPVSAAG